jgi:ADP-ribose pyrophosphatase YjhB (NUDIX family)
MDNNIKEVYALINTKILNNREPEFLFINVSTTANKKELKLPGGPKNNEEQYDDAMNRELKKEMLINIDELKKLSETFTTIDIGIHKIYVFEVKTKFDFKKLMDEKLATLTNQKNNVNIQYEYLTLSAISENNIVLLTKSITESIQYYIKLKKLNPIITSPHKTIFRPFSPSQTTVYAPYLLPLKVNENDSTQTNNRSTSPLSRTIETQT